MDKRESSVTDEFRNMERAASFISVSSVSEKLLGLEDHQRIGTQSR